MPDIVIPDAVVVGDPVEAGDFNTARDAIEEIVGSLNSIENSQLIDGSFETGLTSWVASNIGGGSNAIETSVVVHGAQSFKATATAGGGYVDLDSDDFLNVSAEIDDVFIDGRIYATAGLQVQGWIEWFDSSDVSISTHQFMDHTFTTFNTWLRFRGWGRAVATARSYKLSFQLGDGTVAGIIYLDGITSRLNNPYPLILLDTSVLFSTLGTSTASAKIPVIGSAYKAWTYYSAAIAEEFMYNPDTGNWVSAGSARGVNPLTTQPPIPFDGIPCDESGQVRARSNAGTINWFYNMWR